MTFERFALQDLPGTPWKNGGGITREIVCWPPGSGLDDFWWRASVATIDAAGPFSAFPGVDRTIMLLEGAGVLRGASAVLEAACDAGFGLGWGSALVSGFGVAGAVATRTGRRLVGM